MTRDGTSGLTSVYQNGSLAFSFIDSSNLAVLADATPTGNAYLSLFQDDGAGLGAAILSEQTLGDVARLRLYNGALSAAQVAALDTTIPEPTCLALFGIATAMIPLRRNR